MKKKFWIFLFAVVLLGDIIGIQLADNLLQTIFKPLIIPVLIGYFDAQVKIITTGLAKWILFALLFSLLGDVLLMFQEKKAIFFLLGLSSFLIAHIFYIIFFNGIWLAQKIKNNSLIVAVVLVYYAVLMILLLPYLGDMKLPVMIYGLVISYMLMMAMNMLFIKNKKAGQWMVTGAFLFVLSDSTLAINKFYQPFEAASVLIMLTYGLAQLFIVEGAIRYITSTDKE
jgi:uncharacterized membrane protein YhhN